MKDRNGVLKNKIGEYIYLGEYVVSMSDITLLGSVRKGIWNVAEELADNKFKVVNIISHKNFITHKNKLLNIKYLEYCGLINSSYLNAESIAMYRSLIPQYNDKLDTLRYAVSEKSIHDLKRVTKKGNHEMANTVNKLVNKNAEAARQGALLAAGKTLNGVIKNKVVDQLPRKYRGLGNHALADVVIANIASFAVQNFASGNYKAQVATDAMMEAAMAEFFSSFNLEAIVSDALSTVNIDEFVNTTGG